MRQLDHRRGPRHQRRCCDGVRLPRHHGATSPGRRSARLKSPRSVNSDDGGVGGLWLGHRSSRQPPKSAAGSRAEPIPATVALEHRRSGRAPDHRLGSSWVCAADGYVNQSHSSRPCACLGLLWPRAGQEPAMASTAARDQVPWSTTATQHSVSLARTNARDHGARQSFDGRQSDDGVP